MSLCLVVPLGQGLKVIIQAGVFVFGSSSWARLEGYNTSWCVW